MSRIERSEPYVYGFPRARYDAASDFIRPFISPQKAGIQIVDIGGFAQNPIVERLYPDVQTVALNVPWEYHIPKRTGDGTYDGEHIPLADNSVPVLMAIDVFEQIPGEKRFQLIKEMVRVAQDKVVISGPFYSRKNLIAEVELLKEMESAGLPPKASIVKHQEMGLPKLEELVDMARRLRLPFHLFPATLRDLDFQGLRRQIEIYRITRDESNLEKIIAWARNLMGASEIAMKLKREFAQTMARNTDEDLCYTTKPTWPDAYRAVLVIDKKPHGRILADENDYIYSSSENTAYGRALALAGHGNIENPLAVFKEIKQRGLNIAFEGPDGVGKTDTIAEVAEKLAEWGYIVATPIRYGPRQRLREWEKKNGVLPEPAREALLVDTTNQSIIAANAHTLLGPCCIALSDRNLASTLVYHKIHGLQGPVEYVLGNTYTKPPDLTIILEVDNFEENWRRKGVKGDAANAQITQEQLQKQREYYGKMTVNKYTGPIWRVKSNGTVEETAEKVLKVLGSFFGISTRR